MRYADIEDDPDTRRILRHIELIDDEASEYGIKIVKSTDRLMAKKYGFRNPPGITYFRKGFFLLASNSLQCPNSFMQLIISIQASQSTTMVTLMTKKRYWIG